MKEIAIDARGQISPHLFFVSFILSFIISFRLQDVFERNQPPPAKSKQSPPPPIASSSSRPSLARSKFASAKSAPSIALARSGNNPFEASNNNKDNTSKVLFGQPRLPSSRNAYAANRGVVNPSALLSKRVPLTYNKSLPNVNKNAR